MKRRKREYRIRITCNGKFCPQIKKWWGWHTYQEYGISGNWDISFDEKEDCIKFIQDREQAQQKIDSIHEAYPLGVIELEVKQILIPQIVIKEK